jgi:sorbitol/mannitol transport system substrate-binding protein
MVRVWLTLFGFIFLLSCSGTGSQHFETVTIATVNNADMIRMKALSKEFTSTHPNIRLSWITLEENVLRQRVTVDVATGAGQFDIVTIGSYEVPMWARQGWLRPLDQLGQDYDSADLLAKVKAAVSYQGKLYASPFYGESSFTMYRTDLFRRAGLKMPEHPTWDFIEEAANKLNDPAHDVFGVCLRGKAGWGENMALLTVMSNSFGGRLFDESWRPKFDSPEWARTLNTYVRLMKNDGPPGASVYGFNENLALFDSGKCAVWVDSTVAASFISDPKTSTVAGKVGYAFAPNAGLGKSANWLFSWTLAIPASSHHSAEAQSFIKWATDKHYAELVARIYGWSSVPPGTRKSLYANASYQAAAPFARVTLHSIDDADPNHPTVKPVPYVGVQFAAIPEFQSMGTQVGQYFSAALAGTMTTHEALLASQKAAQNEMMDGGYIR